MRSKIIHWRCFNSIYYCSLAQSREQQKNETDSGISHPLSTGFEEQKRGKKRREESGDEEKVFPFDNLMAKTL